MNHQIDVETIEKRFEVRNWQLVGLLKWDIEIEICAICRNKIYEPCIECDANSNQNKEIECHIALGTCKHAFHFHCISRRISSLLRCPLDNLEWEFQQIGK